MGDFDYIDHTADKGFRVVAESKKDLFETSVKGLAKLLREDLSTDVEEYSRHIQVDVENDDITALLVDFLSEVLTHAHIHKTVFLNANISDITDRALTARISGVEVDYFDEVIKTVTFHQAGRNMSRTSAKKQVDANELLRELKSKDIHVQAASKSGVAEEAPLAYKEVRTVVDVVEDAGLAEKTVEMKPAAVIKG